MSPLYEISAETWGLALQCGLVKEKQKLGAAPAGKLLARVFCTVQKLLKTYEELRGGDSFLQGGLSSTALADFLASTAKAQVPVNGTLLHYVCSVLEIPSLVPFDLAVRGWALVKLVMQQREALARSPNETTLRKVAGLLHRTSQGPEEGKARGGKKEGSAFFVEMKALLRVGQTQAVVDSILEGEEAFFASDTYLIKKPCTVLREMQKKRGRSLKWSEVPKALPKSYALESAKDLLYELGRVLAMADDEEEASEEQVVAVVSFLARCWRGYSEAPGGVVTDELLRGLGLTLDWEAAFLSLSKDVAAALGVVPAPHTSQLIHLGDVAVPTMRCTFPSLLHLVCVLERARKSFEGSSLTPSRYLSLKMFQGKVDCSSMVPPQADYPTLLSAWKDCYHASHIYHILLPDLVELFTRRSTVDLHTIALVMVPHLPDLQRNDPVEMSEAMAALAAVCGVGTMVTREDCLPLAQAAVRAQAVANLSVHGAEAVREGMHHLLGGTKAEAVLAEEVWSLVWENFVRRTAHTVFASGGMVKVVHIVYLWHRALQAAEAFTTLQAAEGAWMTYAAMKKFGSGGGDLNLPSLAWSLIFDKAPRIDLATYLVLSEGSPPATPSVTRLYLYTLLTILMSNPSDSWSPSRGMVALL
eukprot:Sspe_Gene.89047::Locus_60917_Transcript_1_1_Confidence_1.000_Length_1927::g.89047::m.89047